MLLAFAQTASAYSGVQPSAVASVLPVRQAVRSDLIGGLVRAVGHGADWLNGLAGQQADRCDAESAADDDARVTAFQPAEVNGYPGR